MSRNLNRILTKFSFRINFHELEFPQASLCDPPEIKINTVSPRAGIEHLDKVLTTPKTQSLFEKDV